MSSQAIYLQKKNSTTKEIQYEKKLSTKKLPLSKKTFSSLRNARKMRWAEWKRTILQALRMPLKRKSMTQLEIYIQAAEMLFAD